MTKLIALMIAAGAVAAGQALDPQIQTRAIWQAYQAFFKAKTGEKLDCSGAPATRSKELNALCNDVFNLVDPNQSQVEFAHFAVNMDNPGDPLNKTAILSFLSKAAESRLDTQNGGSSSQSGTTSAVERSGISDVLGAALEGGAVTQTVSGTSLTLQANALSIKRFVAGENVFQYCSYDQPDCEGAFASFLNKLSATASLSLSNASTQTVSGTMAGSGGSGSTSGSSTQTSAAALLQSSASHLTGFTIRFQPINQLDLRSKAYLSAFAAAFKDPTLQTAANNANNAPDFTAWFHPARDPDHSWLLTAASRILVVVSSSKTESGLESALAKEVSQQWASQMLRWTTQGLKIDDLSTFLKEIDAYMLARDAALNAIRQKLANGLTFEYGYSRPNNQPRVSTARVIYTYHPRTIAADTSTTQPKAGGDAAPAKPANTNDSAITVNFAADMYDAPPSGTNALKDLQAALQLDHHFGNSIFTLAAYDQYQHSASALNITAGNLVPGTNIMLNGTAGTLLAPKGNIVVAQAMWTFALKSGTKLPVGVTWSNRTDLIKGNEFRGHVGFNFDWSSLLLAKSANSSQN